jgi:restriction system protein
MQARTSVGGTGELGGGFADVSQEYKPESSYHYPPDLLDILIEAIPLIFRSKPAVLRFFRSIGLGGRVMSEWEQRLASDRDNVRKAEIVQSVLVGLNEAQSNDALRLRREVIRRVVEIEDFSTAWEGDRIKAEALVGRIRRMVEVKDSFVKMNLERERERQERTEAYRKRIDAERRKREEREDIKKRLYALFSETDHGKRGKALELVLAELFRNYDILVKEPFTRTAPDGKGITEQIDGAVQIDSHLYLVEVKWWQTPIGPPDVAQHIVKVKSRAGAGGIFISASPYTAAAVSELRDALHQRVHIACQLDQIVLALVRDADLLEYFRRAIHAAITDRNPVAD